MTADAANRNRFCLAWLGWSAWDDESAAVRGEWKWTRLVLWTRLSPACDR
jgi:hypothetical protein